MPTRAQALRCEQFLVSMTQLSTLLLESGVRNIVRIPRRVHHLLGKEFRQFGIIVSKPDECANTSSFLDEVQRRMDVL